MLNSYQPWQTKDLSEVPTLIGGRGRVESGGSANSSFMEFTDSKLTAIEYNFTTFPITFVLGIVSVYPRLWTHSQHNTPLGSLVAIPIRGLPRWWRAPINWVNLLAWQKWIFPFHSISFKFLLSYISFRFHVALMIDVFNDSLNVCNHLGAW